MGIERALRPNELSELCNRTMLEKNVEVFTSVKCGAETVVPYTDQFVFSR